MHSLFARRRLARVPFALIVASMIGGSAVMAPLAYASQTSTPSLEFMPAVELAPLAVKGRSLSVSILARTKRDRAYAEKFAGDVVEVADATLERSLGRGLVIVGQEGEPHPVFVFRKFVELSNAGQLDPAMSSRATEASELMRKWEDRLHLDEAAKQGMPIESFLPALPLPLEGVASKLYQLAWAEGFDDNSVEQKLRTLTPADFEQDPLARFDWVFYLPPREAAGKAIKAAVPIALKKEKVGVFKRAAVRSALVVFSPAVKKAVEAARKGMLYMTLLHARSGYSEDDMQQLIRVYVRVLMPDFKFNDTSGNTRERAIAAIEAQKIVNAEYAKDPYVAPPRLTEYDPSTATACVGYYAAKPGATYRFVQTDEGFTWQFRELKPHRYYPAGERLFVAENGDATLRFVVDEAGAHTGVEQRSHRSRQLLARTVEPPASPAKKAKQEN